ncbi:drug/metabolite transporter (DMT)-like permease [Gracilibacillus halotolerans]|uniref:Drug/metabolite transporter (DMT)-like permease n=1 Tax=Gracilibacillus halotolerans TaxID=74386 RepID=A0A841RNT8_9BACI|nr:DMT family transporter [Gracilibacillus halotolerans]MBB6513542.1 drug/metabolite transporter (DMT)-like permease [Gracilibacillus halotolerans]
MKAYILLMLTALFYAGNLVVGKPVTSEIPPIFLSFIRYIISLLVVLPIGLREFNQHRSLFVKEWKAIIGLSVTGIVLFNIFVYTALQYTSAINAGIMEASTPVFTLLLSIILLKESVQRRQFIGIASSLIGVVLIVTKGSLAIITGLEFNRGDIFMLAAMISWSFYSILIRQHMWKFPAYGVLMALFIVSLVLFTPMLALEWDQIKTISWSPSIIAGVLYLGIFPSLLALIAFNIGVRELGPTRASVFLNLVPVFTLIGAVVFLNEKATWLQIAGTALVISGVWITNKMQSKK